MRNEFYIAVILLVFGKYKYYIYNERQYYEQEQVLNFVD